MKPFANPMPIVGVMGSGSEDGGEAAVTLGRLLARRGVHLLTGGGGGVMAAVSEAFFKVAGRQGLVLGILPCLDNDPLCKSKPGYPNPWVELPIRTHLPLSGTSGQDIRSRNHINILTADVVIALPGSAGTLSEIALAQRYKKPLIVFQPPDQVFPGLAPETPVVTDLAGVEDFLDRWMPR